MSLSLNQMLRNSESLKSVDYSNPSFPLLFVCKYSVSGSEGKKEKHLSLVDLRKLSMTLVDLLLACDPSPVHVMLVYIMWPQ